MKPSPQSEPDSPPSADPTHELCILFAYHRVNALSRRHLELVRAHNPGVPVVPLTDDVPEHFEDGVDVAEFDDPFAKSTPWRRCDSMVYRWFLNRTVTAARYVYLEYDCLCTVSLAEAYAEVWDRDVAAAAIPMPEHSQWMWFDEIDRLAPEDRPWACGTAPLAGMFFSHRALERIAATVSRDDVFCELRLATAARKAGYAPVHLPAALRRTLRSSPYPRVPTAPGLYHPVKHLTNPTAMASSMNLALHRPATQSSASPWSRGADPSVDAGGACNGHIDGTFGFHTAEEDSPWWQVDLGGVCRLQSFRIYNRLGFGARLARFTVLASPNGVDWQPVHRKDDDAWFGQDDLTPYVATLPPDTRGRFVRVVLDGHGFLHFSEFEIEGQRLDRPLPLSGDGEGRWLHCRRELDALALAHRSSDRTLRDAVVLAVLGGIHKGYFVELGAGDGVSRSSTRLLEQDFDWQGLVCEPDPAHHDALHRTRACSIDTRCPARESGLEVTDEGGHGWQRYRVPGIFDRPERHGSAPVRARPAVGLATLWDDYHLPATVDYLGVGPDVDALAVLQGLWSVAQPRCRVLSVSAAAVSSVADLDALLQTRGYRHCPAAGFAGDRWYLSEAPPNPPAAGARA